MPTSESQAWSILSPFASVIYDVIASGWSEYNLGIGEWGPDMTDRSRASIVHDLTIRSAIQQLDGMPDVRVLERDRLFLFIFQEVIALRFKKLDENKRSRGIPTQASLDFLAQQEIPGISSTLHLEAGYVLNQLQTDIDGIYVVCPYRDRVSWSWELQAPAVGQVVQFGSPQIPSHASVFQLFESTSQQQQDGSEGQ